ncbi:hypothetical protein, partial [Stenotrophomonas sp. TEPEL]|uniref:hypothetical protein n=1 Tax=Stenotrophomonas sp. TEPEL TaxID=2283801 RepID=UPI0019812A20
LFGDLQFETNLISIHVTLGVGSGVQLQGVTSPWGLDGAIHGANGPAAPYRPALDGFPMTVVDPRHAWMNFQRNRIFRQLNEEHPRMAWIYRVGQGDIHQEQALPFQPIAEPVEGGVGPVAGA